jgi:hypothetical protein
LITAEPLKEDHHKNRNCEVKNLSFLRNRKVKTYFLRVLGFIKCGESLE